MSMLASNINTRTTGRSDTELGKVNSLKSTAAYQQSKG